MTASELRLNYRIIERGKLYHVALTWYDQNGKRQRTTKSTGYKIGNNKRKAQEKAKEIYKDYERKLLMNSLEAEKIYFADWMCRWLEYKRDRVAADTFYNYERDVKNRINPYFEERKITLSQVEVHTLEEFYYCRMHVDGVSAATIKHYHANIRNALRWALKSGVIARNPASEVELPRAEKHRPNVYSPDKLLQFMKSVKGTELEVPIFLAATYGLRRSEVLGLRWEAIDFDHKQLQINGTLLDQGANGCEVYFIEKTKTKKSNRTLPMDDIVVNYLKELKKQQELRKSAPGYNHKWDKFVCVRNNGDIIKPNLLTHKVPELCLACGLPRLKLHELRHTRATLLLLDGMQVKDVSDYLGHSTYNTTMDLYATYPQMRKNLLLETSSSFIRDALT